MGSEPRHVLSIWLCLSDQCSSIGLIQHVFYCYSAFDLEVSAFGRQCGECSLCITAGGGGAGWRWWAVFLCTGCESCVRDVLTKHGQTSSRAAKGGMWDGDELAPKQFIKRTLTAFCLHGWATPTRAPTLLFSLFSKPCIIWDAVWNLNKNKFISLKKNQSVCIKRFPSLSPYQWQRTQWLGIHFHDTISCHPSTCWTGFFNPRCFQALSKLLPVSNSEYLWRKMYCRCTDSKFCMCLKWFIGDHILFCYHFTQPPNWNRVRLLIYCISNFQDCMERSGTFRSEALGEAVFSFWCKKYQRSVLVNAHVSFFENKSQSKSNRAGQKPFTEDFKWRLTGRLASVKPTGCPRVTPKLALRVLTQRRRTHYPANDGITALTHRVATCKWWGKGEGGARGSNRLSSEKKRHFPRKSSCQGEGKKVEMDINSQEWKLRWL